MQDLFEILQKRVHYLIDDYGESSPFENTQFALAFEKAKSAAFDFFAEDSQEKEQGIDLSEWMKKLSQATEMHPIFKESIFIPNSEKPREQSIWNMLILFASLSLPRKVYEAENNKDFGRKIISNECVKTGKKIVSLTSTVKAMQSGKKIFSIAGCKPFAGPLSMDKLLVQMGYKVSRII